MQHRHSDSFFPMLLNGGASFISAVLDLAAVLFTSEPLRTFGFENLTLI